MDQHLAKPVHPRELIRAINGLLASRRMAVAAASEEVSGSHALTNEETAIPPDCFDLEDLIERCMGDRDLMYNLLGQFPEDCRTLVDEFEAALAQRDAKRLAKAAHSLKGLTANLAAPTLNHQTVSLEASVRAEKWEEAVAHCGADQE